MKKLITTLLLFFVAIVMNATQKTYVVNSSNLTAFGTPNSDGITVTNDGGKTLASGKDGTLKYSVDVNYTFTFPSGTEIVKMKVSGYNNYDELDAYISAINGVEQTASKYVFPQEPAGRTSYTTVEHDIDFATPVKDKLEFRISGKQCCLIFTFYEKDDGKEPEKPAVGPFGPFEYKTTANQMEKLNRGLVVVPAVSGNLVSWRWLGTDGLGDLANVSFDVLRNGTVVKSNITTCSNYNDKTGTASHRYSIRVKNKAGEVIETTPEVTRQSSIMKQIQLDRPTDTRNLGCEYTPNDMSVGDLDGDGEYELIVKWNPTNSRDNSQEGETGTVYLDAYKLDGTKLWRIDMGENIRAGAHYTQFLVYDFDGDGKAEMMCKTALGTIDGTGNYVNQATDDDRIKNIDNTTKLTKSKGHIINGAEFLTVFNGETGAAMQTVWFNPPRSGVPFATGATTYGKWESVAGKSTNYNRGERYNAAVAYLDGMNEKPSAVFQRGYYTYAFFWAVDWDGTNLTTKWLHYGDSKTTWKTYGPDGNVIASNTTKATSGAGKSSFGQGVHGISVGDVDNDGYDEIVMGAATIAHDGTLMCSTGKGHGDAIHLSDLCPDLDGLEIMMPHEESPYGYDVHNAATGKLIVSANSSGDNGRGMAADIFASNRGFEFWSSAENDVRSCLDGTSLGTKKPSTNFRIYWDGDLQDELFDGKYTKSTDDALQQNDLNGTYAPQITKMTSATSSTTLLSTGTAAYGMGSACNTTKATPCLIADILGDWREELILWSATDPSKINIYTTNTTTTYAVPTLMHDHVYRMGVAWQNSSYNQPPHLGYYLPDMFDKNYGIYSQAFIDGIETVEASADNPKKSSGIYDLFGRELTKEPAQGVFIKNGNKYAK